MAQRHVERFLLRVDERADEMAFVHNLVGKTGVHSQATYLQATGFQLPGFPGMGCWVSYGLGSMNENLPAFVVLPEIAGLLTEIGERIALARRRRNRD